MDSNFKNAGLGMMNMADDFAKKGMNASSDRKGEFLGGLLSFLGVGKDTIQGVKDFQKNPMGTIQNAVVPKGPSQQFQVNPVGVSNTDSYDIGGGFSPAGSIPPNMQQPIANGMPVMGSNPVAGAPAVVDPLELERQETQRIRNSLIPRNL